MAATDISSQRADVDPLPRRRRPWRSRVSSGHVVTVVAALLAAVANYAVLRSDSGAVPVVVAVTDISAGTTLGPDDLRVASVGGRDGLDGLIGAAELPDLEGRVARVTIPAGAPLRHGDLADGAASEGRRIALPVDRERAVGGDIAPGDLIDVIRVVDGAAAYLVSGARVLDVADESHAGIGAPGGFHVTIAVDADTALCLAAALDGGALTVVLSTGQDPVPTTPCSPPPGEVTS